MRVPPFACSLAAMLVGAFFAGCSSYRAPVLSIADARIIDATPEGAAIVFTLDARNDNTEALPLREVRYSLELGGKRVFTGVRSAEATLRRRGTQQLKLPAAIPAETLARVTRANDGEVSYRLRGTITYITPGALAEVLFDTGVRRPKVSFAGQGKLDLNAPPRATPPPPPAPPTTP